MGEYLINIKAVQITEYARRKGFTVVRKGRYCSLLEHDSVRIDTAQNCFWRNSVFTGSGSSGAGSVIDFAMEFCSYPTAAAAISAIAADYGITKSAPYVSKSPSKTDLAPAAAAGIEKRSNGPLALPPKGADSKAAFHYLCRVRGIDLTVVRYFHSRGLFYEDDKSNVVFVSNGFACVRSTTGSYMADVPGNDYNECFFVRCKAASKALVLTESVIDAMSLMTHYLRQGMLYTGYCYLALCGTAKLKSLYKHVEREAFDSVTLALDNDASGRRAAAAAVQGLADMGFNGSVTTIFPPVGKDWNDYINTGV